MTEPVVSGVIAGYFAAINGERWDALRRLWTEDAEVRAVGARPRHGPDDIVDYFAGGLFGAWKVHVDTPTRALPSGDAVTVEVRFDGETHDGRRLSFDAVDVFDLCDGRIARLTNWYDLVRVRRMLAGD
jgi:ketosteroid isomerase-like protein